MQQRIARWNNWPRGNTVAVATEKQEQQQQKLFKTDCGCCCEQPCTAKNSNKIKKDTMLQPPQSITVW